MGFVYSPHVVWNLITFSYVCAFLTSRGHLVKITEDISIKAWVIFGLNDDVLCAPFEHCGLHD